jgi:hypothetical protein
LHAVDNPVAIVVKTVADFCGWSHRTTALKFAIVAHRYSTRALAQREPARLVGVHRVIVDVAVAVVVAPIATLHRGATYLADSTLVDEAIAIVVKAVTNLVGSGKAGASDLASSAVTGRVAHSDTGSLANPFETIIARFSLVRKIFVDLAVAVVV